MRGSATITRKRAIALSLLVVSAASVASFGQSKLTYPTAKKGPQVDDYSGVKVADPYRWLENPDSPGTTAWVEAENKVTAGYFAKLPGRERIKERLTRLFDYERFSSAFQSGGRYFVFRNDGLQNQSVLYTLDSLNATPRVLLDPNTLRKDGTAALTSFSVSPDGKLLAYGIAQAGSDWSEWRVRDTATGKDLSDLIQWIKFAEPSWLPDGRGFYYSRFPKPDEATRLKAANEDNKLYLHRIGDPQEKDALVYERPDHKLWQFGGQASEDGHYLAVAVFAQDAGKNLFFYRDLSHPGAPMVELIPKLTNIYEWLGSEGSTFYFRTTDGAPRGRVIAIDVKNPDRANWKEIIAERKEAIDSVQLLDGKLIVSYIKDAHAEAALFTLAGKPIGPIALPGIGTASWSTSHQHDREIFYSFTTFTSPASIYRFDLRTGHSTPFRSSKLSFDPAAFESKQIFYTSKDGTRVPMFLVYKKGLVPNGANPTLLYGYGGFNIAVTPTFNPSWIEWMEMGGIFAVANIRGGSEYGEEWHTAGTKLKKQNVFDDFIAAAEWLIANKYTESSKLAIFGGSNGGLLVGAVLNQRPDLFGAAMPAVGVMDMLRFNKFTVGSNWVGDYGSPENPEEFRALRAYSPLHNIKQGAQYPPVLITTSDHDDRVVPGHSFKYAAALQAAQEGPAPILIRIETRAGHGAGKPVSKTIDEYADRLTFLAGALHIKLAK